MNFKSWFKCNTIRYFALNDTCRDDYKNRYTDSIDNNAGIHNSSQSSASSSIIGSWWNYYSNNRVDKEFARYSEYDNGLCTQENITDGYSTFFINEVRNHYRNDIDNDVYSPLVSLGNNEPGYDFPVWRRHLGRPNRIDESFLNAFTINHLGVDSPELITEIREYQNHYNQYFKSIESLPRIIDSIVKSKFIERGIYPTTSDNYHNVGYYHFGDVAFLLEQVLDNYLHYVNDLPSYRTNNYIAIRSYSKKDDILYLDGLVIGNGNCDQKDQMREALDSIPQIQIILNALRDLCDSRHDLDRRVNRIQTLANPFHIQITRNRYRTLCPCCPTQNASIWDFG
jgi:hypothetical protein